eukprot:TRINITY_DN3750_c0_g1_i2.p1 TRINITY_DN3750_c0_g1~~TRINITY_DN3750_c0_g1_i2.p1  ORF type:complete len:446 (-),score=109.13 TRINITY_DN3750_c0_g1_i2:4-1341(-)
MKTSQFVSLKAGELQYLRVEYYQKDGVGEAKLRWRRPGSNVFEPIKNEYLTNTKPDLTPVTPAVFKGDGKGLRVMYFIGNNLEIFKTSTIDNLDFKWQGAATPVVANGIAFPGNYFSIRAIGSFKAPKSGIYQLQALSDDGVRVWVNGILMIDDWKSHKPKIAVSVAFPLEARQSVNLRVEYHQDDGSGDLVLRWKIPGSDSFFVIPRSYLYEAYNRDDLTSLLPKTSPVVAGNGQGLLTEVYSDENFDRCLGSSYSAVDFERVTITTITRVVQVQNTVTRTIALRSYGYLLVPMDGEYQFQIVSKFGVRLYLNRQLIVSRWKKRQLSTDTTPLLRLEAGDRVFVQIEYLQGEDEGSLYLKWKVPNSDAFFVVPKKYLLSIETEEVILNNANGGEKVVKPTLPNMVNIPGATGSGTLIVKTTTTTTPTTPRPTTTPKPTTPRTLR